MSAPVAFTGVDLTAISSVRFTHPGLTAAPAPDPKDAAETSWMKGVESWHYVRANDSTTRPWHFVYPGRYDATKSAPDPAARAALARPEAR